MISLTKLGSAKRHLEKLEKKKSINVIKISKLENDFIVINRASRIKNAKIKNEKLDEGIIDFRAKITKMIDDDLLGKASNWLRSLTGAKQKDNAKEFRDTPKNKDTDLGDYTEEMVGEIQPEKFSPEFNKDTATPEEISKTQQDLVTYLESIDETKAAEIISDTFAPPEPKKVSENAWATVEDVKRLSESNEAIKLELKGIHEDMIDEQDTSVKLASRSEVVQPEQVLEVDKGTPTTEKSWMDNLLSFLGAEGMKFLSLLAAPALFVAKIMKEGLKSIGKLITKIGSKVGGALSALAKPILDIMSKSFENLKKLSEPILEIFTKAKKFLMSVMDKVSWLIPDSLKKSLGMNVAEEVGEGVAKKASKEAIETGAKKGAEKTAVKLAEKGAGKAILKKLPFVGLLAGIGFGIDRAMDGDFSGAAMEVASGAVSMIPGIGTAASVAIDAGLVMKDINKSENDEQSPNIKNPSPEENQNMRTINVMKGGEEPIKISDQEALKGKELANTRPKVVAGSVPESMNNPKPEISPKLENLNIKKNEIINASLREENIGHEKYFEEQLNIIQEKIDEIKKSMASERVVSEKIINPESIKTNKENSVNNFSDNMNQQTKTFKGANQQMQTVHHSSNSATVINNSKDESGRLMDAFPQQ